MTTDESVPENNILSILSTRRAYFSVIALCCFTLFLLELPTFNNQLVIDDYLQKFRFLGSSTLTEKGVPQVPANPSFVDQISDYFIFSTGIPEDNRAYREYGIFPWWTSDTVKLNFFRPLSALTHWIDYQLWPDKPELMRMQTTLWFIAAMLIAASLFRRFSGNAFIAVIASGLLIFDPSFLSSFYWIASRNTFVALFFGLMTIWLHVESREKNSPFYFVMAYTFFVFTLLSAEGGLASLGIIAAYEMILGRHKHLPSLVKQLAPYVSIFVIWYSAYKMAGFGAAESVTYIDASVSPLRFLVNMLIAPIISGFQLLSNIDVAGPLALLNSVSSTLPMVALIFIAFLWLVLMGKIILPALKQDKYLQFWTLSTALTCVPLISLGAFTIQDRHMIWIGVPGAMLCANILLILRARIKSQSLSRLKGFVYRSVYLYFLFAHLFAGITVHTGLAMIHSSSDSYRHGGEGMPFGLTPEDAANWEDKIVVVVNNHQPLNLFAMVPYVLSQYGHGVPSSIRTLSSTPYGVNLTRTGEYSFELTASDNNQSLIESEFYRHSFWGDMLKDFKILGDNDFSERDIHLNNMSLHIDSIWEGRPDKLTIRLTEKNLENHVWVTWNPTKYRYESVELPEIGGQITI